MGAAANGEQVMSNNEASSMTKISMTQPANKFLEAALARMMENGEPRLNMAILAGTDTVIYLRLEVTGVSGVEDGPVTVQ